MDDLYSLINGWPVISTWETLFYMLTVSLFTLLRLDESCLVNTFSFAWYWGFKNLLKDVPIPDGYTNAAIMAYLVCGWAVFGLIQLYYLRRYIVVWARGKTGEKKT